MTIHKVAELDGALLDAAVAKAEGFPSFWIDPGSEGRDAACVLGPARAEDARFDWSPSSVWEQGGPIIERERIGLEYGIDHATWDSHIPGRPLAGGAGPTPLVAAMRAFVASKFGGEVELPA